MRLPLTATRRYPGKTWFELEHVGEPSRWNTLRALRVLQWWDRSGEGQRRVQPR